MSIVDHAPDSALATAASPPRSSALAFLTLPRLVLAVLFLFLLFKVELTDPDYFWHLRTGEYIATHWSLPNGDPFSWTFEGKPWAPHEWLFQLALYGVFAIAGPIGVKVAVALCALAAIAIVQRTARRLLDGSSVAIVLAVACFLMLVVWFVPRPHVVTYVLVALFVDVLVGVKYFKEDARLWLLPPLMIVWTNLHGAFVIGIALLGLFCACEWALHLSRLRGAMERRRLVRVTALSALVVLATAVNPRGFNAWLFPAALLDDPFAAPVVGEFMSPDFNQVYGRLFLLIVFGFFVATIYRRHKPDLLELAMPIAVLFIGFSAMRHVPVAVLILTAFYAVALRDGPAQAWYARYAGGGRSMGNAEFLINAAILVVLALALLALTPLQQAKVQARFEKMMPVKAAAFVRDHGIDGHLFNDYSQGGYLIDALYPRKVFIDGRGDVYGNAFIDEFKKIRMGEPGWQKAFDARAIDVVLLPRSAPVRDLLLLRGDFRLVYDDENDSVLVRKGVERFDRLPEASRD